MSTSELLPERRDIFLDRDGVINENRDDHVTSWKQFQFLPRALEALRLLTQRRYRIFVITNQAAVGRGLMTRATLEAIHRRMAQVAALHGAKITAVRYCPHAPEAGCTCRKPQPGMLLHLAAQMGIDLQSTYVIGDALTDLQAGAAAGCRTVLVRSGRGAAQMSHPDWALYQPELVVADLLDAVQSIERKGRSVLTRTVTAAAAAPPEKRPAYECPGRTYDAHMA